jgi:hypothetical protein
MISLLVELNLACVKDFVLVQVVHQVRRSHEQATEGQHVSLATLELVLDCDVELAYGDAVAKDITFNAVTDEGGLRGPGASERRRTPAPALSRVSTLSYMGFNHRCGVLRPLFRTLHGPLRYRRSSACFGLCCAAREEDS